MKSLNKQGGAGLGTILFNMIILVFIGFSVVKVGAFYIDNQSVKKSLQSLDEVTYITKKSEREVHELIRKRLSMNNIKLETEEIMVEKRSDRLVVDVNYERRVKMFGNIDAVVSFENHYEALRR